MGVAGGGVGDETLLLHVAGEAAVLGMFREATVVGQLDGAVLELVLGQGALVDVFLNVHQPGNDVPTPTYALGNLCFLPHDVLLIPPVRLDSKLRQKILLDRPNLNVQLPPIGTHGGNV